MTFWEQDKIRVMVWIAEVTFANRHYWPGDNNQHIKSLIGLGREYVNVTTQAMLLNKRLEVRIVFSLRYPNTQKSGSPSVHFWLSDTATFSVRKALILCVKAKVNKEPLAQ